jgi:DNA-directed RNA polymerase specialized sigma24 family protein
MTASPRRQPKPVGDPAHADRVLRVVFGDTDYLARLESMLGARAHLSGADVEAVLEQAVVEAVRQVRRGRVVEDPQGLVWWLAERKAGELSSNRGETMPLDEVLGLATPEGPVPSELVRWRALVERIDQERPRQVWLLLLGAIEAGEDLLSGWEIAQHLGIPETAVRKAISRGRRQLRRLAEAEGLVRMLDDGTMLVEFDDD